MPEEIIVKKIEIRTDKAEQNLGKVEKATDKVSGSTKNLDKSLQQVPGPLGRVQAGVKSLGAAFKALLANPIIALIAGIVVALTGLFRAFTKTQEGADKMKNVMTGLGAAMEVLTERAAMLFKAIAKIFQGKFKEGFQEMGDAVKGVGDEMREASKAAIELEKAQRRLYETESEVIVANAKRTQQISELRLKARDYTVSVKERREAIIEADKIERESLAANIALQEQRVANVKQEIENTPVLQRTREQSRKLAEAEAQLIDIQTRSLNQQRKLKAELNTLDREYAAEQKAAADEAAAAAEAQAERDAEELERRKVQRQEEMDIDAMFDELELGMQKDMQDRLSQMKKDSDAKTTEALVKNANKRFKHEDDLIAEQIKNEQLLASVKAGIYQNSLNALIGFLGEESKIAKGIQIADATRTAISAAISAYKSAVGIPIVGTVLGPIAAAAALAAGMANVRKIAKTTAPVEKGGGASVPSVALDQPTETVDDITNADVGIGQDVNIIQDRTARGTVKAYVVESEVTAAQNIESQRQKEVTL